MTALFLTGHVLDVLRGLPSDLFHVCVTSPPYMGLRSYAGDQDAVWGGNQSCNHVWGETIPGSSRGGSGTPTDKNNRGEGYARGETKGQFCQLCGAWRGGLGSEPQVELYVDHLVEVFREVKRVLRPDGVFWLNCGDSYASGKGTMFNPGGGESSLPGHANLKEHGAYQLDKGNKSALTEQGLKPLDKYLIPFRLALALQVDGWFVRQDCVWSKMNPMPSSTDGTRWGQHRVTQCPKCESLASFSKHVCKVCGWEKPKQQGMESEQADLGEDGQQQSHIGQDIKSSVTWVDCPGCVVCSPNDGYVLRTGSWRPTSAHEFVFMLTKTDDYFCDKYAVTEQGVYPAGETREGKPNHKSLASGSRTTAGLHDKDWVGGGVRNLRSVWKDNDPMWQLRSGLSVPDQICVLTELARRGILVGSPCNKTTVLEE